MKYFALLGLASVIVAALGSGAWYVVGAERAKVRLVALEAAYETAQGRVRECGGNVHRLRTRCESHLKARRGLEERLSEAASSCVIQPPKSVDCSDDGDGGDDGDIELLSALSKASGGTGNSSSDSGPTSSGGEHTSTVQGASE